MWMYTRYGVFSITRSPRDSDHVMQIRSRKRRYLEDLREAVGTGGQIIVTPDADYPFRILVDVNDEWPRIADHLMKESIDYTDFKSHLSSIGFFDDSDNLRIYFEAYGSYAVNSGEDVAGDG